MGALIIERILAALPGTEIREIRCGWCGEPQTQPTIHPECARGRSAWIDALQRDEKNEE